jgi:hypothetical protein
MSTLVYDLAITPLLRSLHNLDAILAKAEDLLQADEDIAEATLINARLHPNMRPMVFQVRVATDTAKGAAARLAGRELPSWADDEATFAELHERVGKAIDFLGGFSPQDFTGAEDRPIELKLRHDTFHFSGRDYIANFVLPNFYFHVTTAYNILRHNGVVIGKKDFLGAE